MAVSTGNLSLDVKYLFITFLQELFSEDSKFTWNSNVRNTKFIISDKNAIDLGVVEKKPALIISRGAMAWTFTSFSRSGANPEFLYKDGKETLAGPLGSADSIKNSSVTDLLRASVTITCVAKHGVLAEELANLVFTALTANKTDLRANGIHKIQALSFGEEQILKSSSGIDLSAVAVQMQYLTQKEIRRGEKQYNIQIWKDGVEQYEGIDYRVELPYATDVIFEVDPGSDSVVTGSYLDAISGDSHNKVTFVRVSSAHYSVPINSVYGYYRVVEGMLIDIPEENDVLVTSGGQFVLVGES